MTLPDDDVTQIGAHGDGGYSIRCVALMRGGLTWSCRGWEPLTKASDGLGPACHTSYSSVWLSVFAECSIVRVRACIHVYICVCLRLCLRMRVCVCVCVCARARAFRVNNEEGQ